MATEITGRNFHVTDDIHELITSKLAKVEDRLFDDAEAAYARLESNETFGKVVLEVQG